jgi:hypothetical protein
LTEKEHSKPIREEGEEVEELRQEEPETSGATCTVEVSTIVPTIDSIALSNQSNLRHHSA